MLLTFIITFLFILICFTIMSSGYILTGNKMSGSCGNSKENPCDCTFAEKIKCTFNKE